MTLVALALLGFFWGVAVTVVTLRFVDGHSWAYWRTIDLQVRCDELESRNQRLVLSVLELRRREDEIWQQLAALNKM